MANEYGSNLVLKFYATILKFAIAVIKLIVWAQVYILYNAYNFLKLIDLTTKTKKSLRKFKKLFLKFLEPCNFIVQSSNFSGRYEYICREKDSINKYFRLSHALFRLRLSLSLETPCILVFLFYRNAIYLLYLWSPGAYFFYWNSQMGKICEVSAKYLFCEMIFFIRNINQYLSPQFSKIMNYKPMERAKIVGLNLQFPFFVTPIKQDFR